MTRRSGDRAPHTGQDVASWAVDRTRTAIPCGELFGTAPTGVAVRFDVMDIVRIADGRIVERWGMVDQLSLLRQLGAIPS